jgi:hypothetical protein
MGVLIGCVGEIVVSKQHERRSIDATLYTHTRSDGIAADTGLAEFLSSAEHETSHGKLNSV